MKAQVKNLWETFSIRKSIIWGILLTNDWSFNTKRNTHTFCDLRRVFKVCIRFVFREGHIKGLQLLPLEVFQSCALGRVGLWLAVQSPWAFPSLTITQHISGCHSEKNSPETSTFLGSCFSRAIRTFSVSTLVQGTSQMDQRQAEELKL